MTDDSVSAVRARIRAQVEAWEAQVLRPAERKGPPRRARFETTSGVEVPALLAADREPGSEDWTNRVGVPGRFPFTRGVQPTMYRGRPWTMRQYAGFGTAEESNARYRYLLAQGQGGLSVAFDLPTQMGYDSDAPESLGEVGRVGVAIDSLADMEVLFSGIPLSEVSTSMTINATAATLLALYVAVAEGQGTDAKALRGTIQNDILKEYIARGTFIYPPGPSLRLVTDTFAWCARHAPLWNTISISGYHVREAGCTAAQEIAFTLGNAIAYVEAARRAGQDTDELGRRLSFFFNVHNNFLEEVGKFRAARRLWARVMRDRFGCRDERAMMLRFHSQTAGSTLTAQQPDNNVVRVALQALAAVLGGTQSLHTNSRDEALGLPTEESVRIALRTQQVIASESGVADWVDPLAGSVAVEHFTDELEARAEAILLQVDGLGGMVAAIEQGWVQREIQDAAWAAQRAVERGEAEVVGLNIHRVRGEAMPPVLKVDPALEQAQVERTRRVRATRDAGSVERAIDGLRRAAAGDDNLVDHILTVVRARGTLGEVAGALREVWGRHREVVVV